MHNIFDRMKFCVHLFRDLIRTHFSCNKGTEEVGPKEIEYLGFVLSSVGVCQTEKNISH